MTTICGDHRYGGLARLIRYQPSASFPTINTVSVLDSQTNVLRVNQRLFDRLDPHMQRRVLHTDEIYVEVATTDLLAP